MLEDIKVFMDFKIDFEFGKACFFEDNFSCCLKKASSL